MEEFWLPYIEGYYEVSNEGNIRSVNRILPFSGTYGIRKGIPIKQTKNSKGYLTVIICVDGGRKTEYVHRIVANVFLENPDNLPQVNHKDGNPFNNHEENLEWCTALENQRHAYDIGITKRGSESSLALLRETDIPIIRALHLQGVSYKDIGLAFEVSKSCIQQILRGKTWRHV